MTLNNKGSVTGMLVAGISVIALMATVVGIAQNNASRSTSQAALNSTGVMLQENTLKVERLDDNHLEITGMICYSRHLQSGGKEDWTLWVTDNRGKPMDGENDGSHIDGGRLSVAGNGSFPATCEYVDRAAGIGRMLDKNTKQPHRFSVIATTSRRLTSSYCPEIYLHYRGSWFSGTPFAKITLEEIEGVCGPTTEPTPTDEPATTEPTDEPEETPAPTDILATPTFTPTPTPDGTISGRISIYGCKKPNRASVDFCTGETCDELNGGKIISLPFTTGPSAQGVWLDDTNDDNTWIYNYRISVDKDNNPLDPSKTYFLSRALGWFDNDALFIDSEREQGEKLRVKPGAQRDFKVYASRTCGCAFDAVAYVKDTSGNIITELDNKPGIYGTANNKQFYDRGDKPVESVPFNNLGSNPGRIDVHVTDLGDFRESRTWGRDALAAVKLYADDYRVVKQECISKNASTPSCPGYTTSWSETDMTKLRNPKIFENLRVACNANLEYGWTIEKIPPTPTPQPIGGAPIGAISCGLRDDNNASAPQNEGCKPRNFRIKEIKEGTANLEWDVPSNCAAFSRSNDPYWIIVKKKGTDRIVASRRGMLDEDTGVGADDHNPGVPPHQVTVQPEFETDSDGDKEYYYIEGQEYTAYLYAYLSSDASCMSNPVSLDFTGVAKEDSDDEPGNEDPDEPEEPRSGGVCPQWCTNETYCRNQGYTPKDAPSDQPCGVPGDKWCCPPGTEPPGGSGGNPGDPGQPGQPGNPGTPGGGDPSTPPGGQGVCPANSRGIEGDEGKSFIKFSPESDASVCSSTYPGTRPVNASDGGFCCSSGSQGGNPGNPGQPGQPGQPTPGSTASCPSTHDKIRIPPGICAPSDSLYVRGLGQNEVCCKKRPAPTPAPAEKHKFTVKYKAKVQPFYTYDLYPKISWGAGSIQDYDNISHFRALPWTGEYEDVIVYDELTANRFVIKCEVNVAGAGRRVACQDIVIDIPKDKDGCREYLIEISDGVLKVNRAGGNCKAGASAQVEPEQLDMNSDGVINTIDLQYLYDEYGTEGATTTDVNKDGTVNALDLSVFMDSFGTEL